MSCAAIAHISDLHLGEHPLDIGRADKSTAKSFWKRRRLEMQAHDPFILAALRNELTLAARFVGSPSDAFDFHVISGDISTNATNEGRFAFARAFLTDSVPLDGVNIGLGLGTAGVYCLPGNHDKMFEKTSARYMSAFSGLPARPPFVETRKARNGRSFTFFGIDSNEYTEGNIGVGRIGPETVAWLGQQLTSWSGPADAIRILILHHHPADLNRFRRWSLGATLHDRFTILDEGLRLLDLVKGRIDIIMHGHEHFPVAFREEVSGCIIVSCGTTTQWQRKGERPNSFHVLVFDGPKLRVQQFDWSGRARFRPARDWTFTLNEPAPPS